MKIAYDAKLKRPACVLLQAVLGGDSALAQRFTVESWLVAPTEHMSVYEVNEEQVESLVAMAARDFPMRPLRGEE